MVSKKHGKKVRESTSLVSKHTRGSGVFKGFSGVQIGVGSP
jgi:hypothetical protein